MPDHRQKELDREDRWTRVYKLAPGIYLSESKFQTDGLSIRLQDVEREWHQWADSEKLSFVGAFKQKPRFSSEDEHILEFLAVNGTVVLWEMLALVLTKHSNKKMVLNFLLDRMKSGPRPKANFCQALGVLGERAAIPALHAEYDSGVREIGRMGAAVDRGVLVDFFCCCAALHSLKAPGSFLGDIRKYVNHPDSSIKQAAKRILREAMTATGKARRHRGKS